MELYILDYTFITIKYQDCKVCVCVFFLKRKKKDCNELFKYKHNLNIIYIHTHKRIMKSKIVRFQKFICTTTHLISACGVWRLQMPEFKSLEEIFIHIYTYIRLEYNLYLVLKKKKKFIWHNIIN